MFTTSTPCGCLVVGIHLLSGVLTLTICQFTSSTSGKLTSIWCFLWHFIREEKFITAVCSQTAAAFNSYIYSCFPIQVGCSWLLNKEAATNEFWHLPYLYQIYNSNVKPIFHCDAKLLALGTFASGNTKNSTFALPDAKIPTCWYLLRYLTQIFRVLPDAKP